jgi:hypothetical protein
MIERLRSELDRRPRALDKQTLLQYNQG